MAYCGLLLGLLVAAIHAGVPTNLRITAVLTPSGKVDTRYRDGNDGTAAVPLTWASIPSIAGLQGTPRTVNLRTLYLTEPGSPNATLSTACSPAIGGGWSTTTDGLSFTYSTAYSGLCSTTATRSGFVATSVAYLLTSAATSGSDTAAPTQVIGVAATQIATGIHLAWYPASEPKVASQTESGLKEYRIYRDGSGTALATVVAPDAGLSVQMAGTELGGSTGGSTSQSTSTYSVVSTGDGIGGTSDVGYFVHQQVTGDFRLCADLHTITGGNSNAHVTLMARSSLVGSDPAVFVRQTPVNIRTRGRGAAGAASQNYGSTIVQAPSSFDCLIRTGGTWTTSYSVAGNTFTNVDTAMSVVLPSAVEAGLFVGTGGGSTTTGDFRNVTLTTHVPLAYDDAITDGASHTYTIKAVDVSLNLGTASTSVSATAPATSDVTAPAAPTNVVGGTSASQSVVSWSWTPPTDPSGIRGCTPSIATTSGGTYTDQAEQVASSINYSTGITASTTRWIKVKCADNAGNVGSNSSAVSATSAAAPAADTTPPSVPSGACTFAALAGPCATGLNTTTLRIVTTGSTDGGCGVADYRLYRAGTTGGPFNLVATFTGLTFDYNSGGPAGTTYFFKLSARDCASPQNESAQSATFSGTLATSAGGTLLINETFTSTTLNDVTWYTSTDAGSVRTIAGAGVGNNCGTRDAPYAIHHTTDGTRDTTAHSEIQPNTPATQAFAIGTIYWIGESICVDDPNIAQFGWYYLTQMHGANQGTADNPMFSIQVHPSGNWRIQILGDESNAKPYGRNAKIDCVVPVALHAWTDFVMRFRFGGGLINGVYYGSAIGGFWQVWVKNAAGTYVQCVNDTGNNYFPGDTTAPYAKFGQYKGYDFNFEPAIKSRSVWHDQFRIGKETDGIGFADVEPR